MSALLDAAKSYGEKAKAYGENALEKASEAASEAADKVANTIDPHRVVLENFVEGAVVVLISRSSGQALELVEKSGRSNWLARKLKHAGALPYGDLTVHGKGGEGEGSNRAHWTVVNPGGRRVRLHCDNNYITIQDGTTTCVTCKQTERLGEESLFEISHDEQFVIFESCHKSGHHLGILPDGTVKSALATGTETDACFAVKLISKPEEVQEE